VAPLAAEPGHGLDVEIVASGYGPPSIGRHPPLKNHPVGPLHFDAGLDCSH
jgi:hypothetical protein